VRRMTVNLSARALLTVTSLGFFVLLRTPRIRAEETDAPPPAVSERVEVTATRIPEDVATVPASIDVFTAQDLRNKGAHDLRSALARAARVDIATGGDGGPASSVPMLWGLREFDAFLLVVD